MLQSLQPPGLAEKVLREYRQRTGRDPARVVLHKTSKFDPPERGPKERVVISNDDSRRP